MDKKRIVIALGGNALGNNLSEQMEAAKITAKVIADLIEEGHEVVISHGNGPQVGMINNAMTDYSINSETQPMIPLSVCVAMSQAYIGYDLQNSIHEELKNRNIEMPVTTIITQVLVDANDAAFQNPTKPIGQFMTKKQAEEMHYKYGYPIKEDSGRGYRRVVASPMPLEIIEINAIHALVDKGQLVIASGGGGIPVVRKGNHLKGVNAVIDKDFASCVLAQELNADFLIILTAVEKVAINFGTPDVKWLSHITVDQAKQYINEDQFAPGSMLPKVQAAVDFASSKEGRTSLITLLEKSKDGIEGKTGTTISR